MQALRLRRIHTTKEFFTDQSKMLTEWLVERGHNENEIQQQISNTFMIENTYLLNQKNQAISNRTPPILTYNRTLSDIKRAVNKH